MTQGNEHEKALPQWENGEGPPGDVHAETVDGAEGLYLEPQIQEQLGRVLRSFCDDLVQQPIPDKFVMLLAQLEAKQREKK